MTRNPISRRTLFGLALIGSVTVLSPGPRAADPAPLVPITQLVDGLLQVMRAGRATPFERRVDMLSSAVDAAFDLPAILRESVGPVWQNLPREQRDTLLTVFRRYTIASYVNSFDEYDGQRFEVLPDTRPVGKGQVVVQTRIIPRRGDAHELDYVMRMTDSGWKAVDVLADGSISRVAVQRSDFRRLLNRGGASALVAQLQRKTTDLADDLNG